MGSKRSSKNPSNNNSRPSPPPSNPTVEINPPNPKNSTPPSPSRSHKKQKLSLPPPTEISPHSLPTSRPTSLRLSESDTLKLLKSILSLRAKTGFSLKSSTIPILLEEIKDWAPGPLSEKNIDSKLRHLRFKFNKSPEPGPESSEFDRSFHKLASKVWGPSGEKEERDVALENGEGDAKDELIVEENSYKYLRLALEEYWTESKLNVDTLYAALPRVNPVQAKRLDEKFREVFLGMLKLKMDKNKVSNEIIHASLGC